MITESTDAGSEELRLIRITDGQVSCDEVWEAAYRRFETPEEEIAKFRRRLLQLGAGEWLRDANVAELFCGRGNGLKALQSLGFSRLSGVDLSETLIREYRGPAACYVADCRHLPFDDESQDVLIVQGGLHHLPELTGDLEQALSEARRVLRRDGKFVIVEPWLTPFLQFVHAAIRVPGARRASSRLDALAVMIERERVTYDRWLQSAAEIQELLKRHFTIDLIRRSWGKLMFVGTPRREGATV